jgi:hypothetical protein
MGSESAAAVAFRAARLVVALFADLFVACILPLPLMLWLVLHWPPVLSNVCNPPPDDPGTYCEGPLMLLFFVVLPLISIGIGVLYVALSWGWGRTPMMTLFAVPSRRSRSAMQSSATSGSRMLMAVTAAVATLIACVMGVWAVYAYISDSLGNPTIIRTPR